MACKPEQYRQLIVYFQTRLELYSQTKEEDITKCRSGYNISNLH